MPRWKILIVDDSQTDRELYRRCLLRNPHADYEIYEEALGTSGLAACHTLAPDCIVLDYRLPDLTGVQFLQRLQAHANGRTPAVVVITASGSERVAVETLHHGAHDYLLKGTTTPDQLWRAVDNAIEKATLQRTVQAQHQALQESEARFRAIADYTYDWESWIGPDGCPLWINPAVERMTGWAVADCLAMPDYPLPLIHEADRAQMAAHVRAALAGHSANDVEFRMQHKLGHVLWGAVSWQPILTAGVPHGYRSSVRDITARKHAEEQLRQQAAIIDQVHDCVVATDLAGTITYWNKGAEQLYGYTAAEVLGRSVTMLYAEGDHARLQAEIIAPLRARGELAVEMHVRGKAGTPFLVHLSLSLLRDATGTAVGMIGAAMDLTARHAAEEHVRESEERLRLALRSAHLGIHEWDLQTGTLRWDARVYTQWGIRSEAPVTYATFLAGIHPEDRVHVQAAIDRALAPHGAGHYDAEFRVIGHEDGVERWIVATGQVFVRNGQPVRLLGTSLDITPRKQAEAALRAREERLQALVNLVPEMVWEAAPDGTMLTVSDRWLQYTGMTAAQMAQDWPQLVLHPDDYDRCVTAWTQALATGTPYEIEVRNRRHDGQYRWFLTRAVPLKDTAGHITAWYGTTIDIHERKLLEEQMRASEARLQTALAAAHMGTWELDLVLDRAQRSPRHDEIFGYTTPQAEWGEAIALQHVLPEDHAAFRDSFRRARDEGELHLDVRVRWPDGSIHWISALGRTEYTAQGVPVRMAGVVMDITERKQAEDAQARFIAELQRINAEFQQFSYIVSHDLSEPLRTMRNYTQLLARALKDSLSGDTQEYMAFVTDAAQRMQQMLSDLLAYTRAGQTPEFQAVDCEAVLTQMLSALQARITECGAVITHDPLPTVPGDATRIGQVLQNLIGNALKFCDTRPPRIHIAARKEYNHWEFSVRDNGIGIDPQQIGRLFHVFQRLHTRSEYPGSGIGLAICKRIVEQHGGRIWVESYPGEGSTFHFTVREQPGTQCTATTADA